MGLPRFEIISGAVNGVNLVFATSTAYTPGSVAVFLNGQLLKNSAGDPWAETDDTAGIITLAADCVPRDGDQVAAFYIDTLADFVGSEVTDLFGSLNASGEVVAGLVADVERIGSVADSEQLCGILTDISQLSGTPVENDILSGEVKDC